MTGPAPSATLAARVALALYPPSWRARYADEVRALLDESGAPVVVPAAYVAAVRVTVRAVGGPGGVSPWWFLAVTVAGFGAAGLAAAGPGLALRRLQPRGPALRLAAAAGGIAAAAMLAASAAVIVAVAGLCLWAPGFAGYHHATLPGIFLALVTAAASVTAVSAARAARAARA